MTALFNHLHAASHALRRSLHRQPGEWRSAAEPATAAALRWWRGLWLDKRSSYLAEATDLVDLERRMRHFDRCPHNGGLPPW